MTEWRLQLLAPFRRARENPDGKPPGGLACGALGLSRGSSLNHLNHNRPLCRAKRCAWVVPLRRGQ